MSTSTHREKVTVLIPAFNNAALMPGLLEDVKWADQILVADSFSTDATLEIAKSYGADIIQHEYINSAKQKNWAIPQSKHDWILLIDTDERLTPELQAEIQAILAAGIPGDVDAYRVARQTMFLGQWMKSMNLWPDYQTRLFRKTVGRYEDKEVHADVDVPGKLLTFKHSLIHNATLSLSKQINLLDRYSRYQADELEKRGRRFKWRNLLLRPPAAFVYLYLFKGGIREGFRGLFIAFHTAVYVFFTQAKLWEKEWKAGLRR
jgi:glycosyltransferase involved in cell wall biosynthesis